jgi:STAM-binding protein
LNQDGLNGDSKALLYGSKTDNEIRLSVPVEEELYQLSTQQPSYPPMLPQGHVDRPIFSSRVADSKPECAISDIDHYRRVDVVSSNCKFYLYKVMALFVSYSLAKVCVLRALQL